MPTLDLIVAALFFSAAAGVLSLRALRAWHGYRLQQRTLRLMIEGVRILEEHRAPAGSRPDETS